MITPDYLEYILDMLEVQKQLQESIMDDIIRRILKTDISITDTAAWQAEKLQQSGILFSDITKKVSKASGKTRAEIKRLFNEAEIEVFNYPDEVLINAGINPVKMKHISPMMSRIIKAALTKTSTEAVNLTKTTALTSQAAYIGACDLAHMQVISGAFSYNTAILNAIKAAAKSGVTVLYPSGHKSNIEVAVRRSVLTGINQTYGRLQEIRANELSVDVMEISAHFGARPSHAEWQGQLVSRSGQDGYLSLDDIGYGTIEGFMGINCKHSWYMFFEGYSTRAYTDEQLRELNSRTVTYNGKEYTEYDASKLQRSMERSIRETKRQLTGVEKALNAAETPEAKIAAQNEFSSLGIKLKNQEGKLKGFCKQTNRPLDSLRVQTAGFGRSQAQKAVWANKKAVDNIGKNGIIKEKGLYRRASNSGVFAFLPEKMSKKHIRSVAREFGISLKGITLNIDKNEELIRIPYTGRADPENIGAITFFPNAFQSKEELLRTIFHEKQHVLQYRQYGVEFVQNNRAKFEKIAENAELEFVSILKKRRLI